MVPGIGRPWSMPSDRAARRKAAESISSVTASPGCEQMTSPAIQTLEWLHGSQGPGN